MRFLEADLAGQCIDAPVEFAHPAHDLLGRRLDLRRQLLDRVGHHAETSAHLAGMFGLDRRMAAGQCPPPASVSA
jgi:hypothetical protein